MNACANTLKPERDDTDESLSDERDEADSALMEKRARNQKSADDQTDKARDKGDAAQDEARGKADEANTEDTPGKIGSAVAKERQQADRTLQAERDSADKRLRSERREQAAAMAKLLPLEREKTDRFLLTERLRSDAALAQRDDFMSMVSHDLRDLLHGILLNAQVLSNNASDSDEGCRTVEGMDQVQRYVARMNRLIGDLVDVVSIDAGRLAIQAEPDDAAKLLAEAVEAFTPLAADKKVSLELETIQSTLKAEFDRERMLQVLSNLLSNALKFTPSGGAISVRGECSTNALDVSVSDTGKGVMADQMDAIFERFWQVGKNDRRGLGLGLYISKCIVEGHGGSIRVESQPGAGSVFSLTIPRHAAPASFDLGVLSHRPQRS